MAWKKLGARAPMTVTVKNWDGMEFRDLAVSISPVTTEVAIS